MRQNVFCSAVVVLLARVATCINMIEANPRLQLETLFITDARRRIVSTREPHPSHGPAFVFIRGDSACAWAVHADVPESTARELDRWASDEPPLAAWDQPLLHAAPYARLLGGRVRSGPAFTF